MSTPPPATGVVAPTLALPPDLQRPGLSSQPLQQSTTTPTTTTTTPTPQIEPEHKPLLSADTLYDTTIYSATSHDAPAPYSYRTEYDRTNPINLPKGLMNKDITIVTGPTHYPLLHHYDIICPDVETAVELRRSMSAQFSNLMSPLYLMYRSTDYKPRVVTKDQIPGIIDDVNAITDPHFIPHPLISLNIPMVSNIVQNPLPSMSTALTTGAATGIALHALHSASKSIALSRGLMSLNSNHINFTTFPTTVLHTLSQFRILRNGFGASFAQAAAVWGGFFGLRNYFLQSNLEQTLQPYLSHQPPNSTDPITQQPSAQTLEATKNARESTMINNFAIDGKILVQNDPYSVDLPFALSLKAPPIFPSASEQTLAAIKSAAIMAPLSYIIGSRRDYLSTTRLIHHSLGRLPRELDFARDKIQSQLIAHNPLIPSRGPKVIQEVTTTITEVPGLPKKPLPTFGIVNKRAYETLFWDHSSSHLYARYESKQIVQQSPLKRFNPLLGFTHWKNMLLPSEANQEAYNKIVGRVLSNEVPTQNNKNSPFLQPSLWFKSTGGRAKFQLTAFGCAVALWAHLGSAVYSYEFFKQRQLGSSGKPPYVRNLFGSENPNANTFVDKVFQNEIMYVPNLAVDQFTQMYNTFKNYGSNRDIWAQNRSIEQDEMASEKIKLQGIRDKGAEGVTFQSLIDDYEIAANDNTDALLKTYADKIFDDAKIAKEKGLKVPHVNDFTTENHPHENTPTVKNKIWTAFWSSIVVSAITSFAFYPFISSQTRTLIKQLTTLRPSTFLGASAYVPRSAIFHGMVLGTMALNDLRSYQHQTDFINSSIQSKEMAVGYSSATPDAFAKDVLNPTGEMISSIVKYHDGINKSLDQRLKFQILKTQLAQNKLILPTKNPTFYKDMESTLYGPEEKLSFLNIRGFPYISLLGAVSQNNQDAIFQFTRHARYAAQMTGYNTAYHDGSHGYSKEQMKTLLKRGQYFLPYANLPQSCADCLDPVTTAHLDLPRCQCDRDLYKH